MSTIHNGATVRRAARGAVIVALCFLALAARAASPSTQPAYLEARGPRAFSFPLDHGKHEGFKTEWWYFTGNVADGAGRKLGYQLTFFRTAFAPAPTTRPSPWGMTDVYFAHAAVSDLGGQAFAFKDRIERGREGLAGASDRTMDVSLLDWSARRDETGTIALRADDGDRLGIDLACAPGRGPILQGPGGVNLKGREPGQASYYYSMTRLPTTGTLRINGHAYRVQGESWMDHEFSSNALGKDQAGWDWMGLSLSNGDDLMIYRLRNSGGGGDYLSGTRVTPDGAAHYLSGADLTLAGGEPWKSPASGGVYPQRWALTVKGEGPLVVRSRMPGQELNTSASTKVDYFEGSASVEDAAGHEVGQGYLEMTGYAKAMGSF